MQTQLIEQLSNLTVLEMLGLVKELEAKWGVSSSPVQEIIIPAEVIPAEEKSEFDITLTSFLSGNKIAVIKIIREITKEGLMEAKKLSETLPAKLKEGVSVLEANDIKKKFEDVGAVIEIK
jgi:large subunit ribosomal protein L7/L12